MKKIGDDPALKALQQKLAQINPIHHTLLNHPLVKQIQVELQLSAEEINDEWSALAVLIAEDHACKACKGLAECPNTLQGFFSEYIFHQNRILLKAKKCEKLLFHEKEKYQSSLIKSKNIPFELKDASFAKLKINSANKMAMQAAIKFCNDLNARKYPKGLYVWGSFGVGKSYLMVCIARMLAEFNFPSLMVHVPSLAFELKEAIQNKNIAEKVQVFMETPVLILDDIGAETLSAWLRDEIYMTILQSRIAQRLPTLFTSNYDIKGLENQFLAASQDGDQIKAARLIERIEPYVDAYFIEGANRRRKEK